MESVGASSPSLIAMSELVLPPIDDIPRDDFCELNDEFTQFRIELKPKVGDGMKG
jgi:hypothetical protein